MNVRHVRRRLVNIVMLGSTAAATILTVSVLFFLLGFLIYKGGSALNWAFFTQLPKPVGETGGGMALQAGQGLVKDPVCGMDVDPKDPEVAARKVEHGGKSYYFCSDDCRTKFQANPATYSNR